MRQLVRAFIGLLLLSSSLSYAHDYSQLFDQLKSSVVTLKTFSSLPAGQAKKGMTSKNSLGSGVVISEKGEILTAAHVIQTVDSIHVEFDDGKKILGKVIASDPGLDLALLQLDKVPENLAVARLGNSDKAKIGHEIIVIGAPLGLKHTLTAGYISSRRAASELEETVKRGDFLQIDAAVNPGNSGGPVVNQKGEVIGIVSHIKSLTGGSDGLGFAVSSNSAADFIKNDAGFWSGLTYLRMTPTLAKVIHYPFDYGILVQNISKQSAAAKAGIRGGEIPVTINEIDILLGGDVIVSVESIPLKGEDSRAKIINKLKKIKSGKPFAVKIYRKGETQDIKVKKP